MTTAAKTIVAFGIYMSLNGTFLVVAPGLLLPLLGLSPNDAPLLRLLGMFTVIVSYYYYRTAMAESTAFFRATVHGRMAMALFMTALWLWYAAAPVLMVFAVIEITGAMATALALRSSSPAVERVSALARGAGR